VKSFAAAACHLAIKFSSIVVFDSDHSFFVHQELFHLWPSSLAELKASKKKKLNSEQKTFQATPCTAFFLRTYRDPCYKTFLTSVTPTCNKLAVWVQILG